MGEFAGDEHQGPWEIPLNQDFIASARVREDPAHVRASRAARIARDHNAAAGGSWRTGGPTAATSWQPAQQPRRGLRAAGTFVAVAAVVAGALYIQTGHLVPGRTVGAFPGTSLAGRAANPNLPPPGVEEHSSRIGHPPAGASGSVSYKFLYIQPDRSGPVAYDPCRPIHYVVNPANEPPGAASRIETSVAEASRATGLQFIYDGQTSEQFSSHRAPYQPSRYPGQWAPVLISFTAPGQRPDSTHPQAIGIGGSAVVQPGPTGTKFLIGGGVLIDSTWATHQLNGPSPAKVTAALEHELGHVLGLAHVKDPSQLMNPSETSAVNSYQAGDLAGLAKLGIGRCSPNL